MHYRTFDEWINEVENFATRGERAYDDLGDNAMIWLKTAWVLGWCAAEKTADGHAGEAMKDVLNAGWPEAAEVIESKTLPESASIIRANIEQALAELKPAPPKETE